jgi:hypothetical protein
VADFGIPYAYHYTVVDIDDHFVANVVKCPVCGVYIEEVERKDEESHSGVEYAEHYEQQHSKGKS